MEGEKPQFAYWELKNRKQNDNKFSVLMLCKQLLKQADN